MDSLFTLVIIIFGILQIVLFFKIWKMTNDLGEIKKLYKFGSTRKEYIMKAVLMDDKQAILGLVCDSFVNEIIRVNYVAMSESKFEKSIQEIITKHELLLQKYDIEVPDFSIYAKKERVKFPL